jgi:cysteine desulfuration protein SufE
MTTTLAEFIDDYEFLDDWEDRFRSLIELGDELPPLAEELHAPEYLVQGCQSKVWLAGEVAPGDPPRLVFQADSDAKLVKGLVALLLLVYSNKTPRDILDFDAEGLFKRLQLSKHLVPMRSNGLRSMVNRIRQLAAENA